MPPERKKRLLPLAENSISKYGEDGQNLMLYPEVFARLNAPFAAEKSPYSFITSDSSKWKWIARLPFKGPDYSNRFFRDFILLQADLATKETLENIVPPLADTPILLLTGSNDVTAANGTYGDTKAKLLCKAGYKDVTSIVYPGLRHSVLQEYESARRHRAVAQEEILKIPLAEYELLTKDTPLAEYEPTAAKSRSSENTFSGAAAYILFSNR